MKDSLSRLTSAILILFFISGCEDSKTSKEIAEAGDLEKSELIQDFTQEQLAVILHSVGILGSDISGGGVKALKITYWSPDMNGELQLLSGAVILPNDEIEHPLLGILHGTVTKRSNVASVNPMNSSAGMSGLLAAARGYIALVPDYTGFGDSQVQHPYLHAESLAQSVVDMILAAYQYLDENSLQITDELFLTGYSEGGFAALASQRSIERDYSDRIHISAVAPMAGPYDLYSTASILIQRDTYWPAYIGFLFSSYNSIYDLGDLETVFKAPYADNIPGYYSGDMDFFEINERLPQQPEDLFTAEFIAEFSGGNEALYSAAFADNSLLDWTPVAPLRFFHGMSDLTVPYSIAQLTVDSLIANGAAEIELVGIPLANHSTAGIPALLGALEWFDNLQVSS